MDGSGSNDTSCSGWRPMNTLRQVPSIASFDSRAPLLAEEPAEDSDQATETISEKTAAVPATVPVKQIYDISSSILDQHADLTRKFSHIVSSAPPLEVRGLWQAIGHYPTVLTSHKGSIASTLRDDRLASSLKIPWGQQRVHRDLYDRLQKIDLECKQWSRKLDGSDVKAFPVPLTKLEAEMLEETVEYLKHTAEGQGVTSKDVESGTGIVRDSLGAGNLADTFKQASHLIKDTANTDSQDPFHAISKVVDKLRFLPCELRARYLHHDQNADNIVWKVGESTFEGWRDFSQAWFFKEDETEGMATFRAWKEDQRSGDWFSYSS